MTKPTIVCVPGAWHSPEIYHATFEILKKHDYETVGIPLLSVGAHPPHKNFDGDVKSIRDTLIKLIEGEGKDVVLVTHSYSGVPGCVAPQGLGKKERIAKGLPGGVIRMGYLQSFAMPEGYAAEGEYPYWMKYDPEKGVVTVEPDDAKALFYNDIPQHEADKWIAKLRPQSEGVYHSKITYAAWKDIPSTFIKGLQDTTFFSMEVCDQMISNARQANPDAFDVIEECPDGGHCLMVSHPDWLADVLRRVAGEKI